MRHLSEIELETFKRGQAAGLIPPETSVPASEKAVDELIFHIGIMETVDVGYRNRAGKLHVMRIATFTSERLEHVIRHLPEFRRDEVRSVTALRETVYLPALESLSAYFAFGPTIVSKADLNGRLALGNIKITKSQILKGF